MFLIENKLNVELMKKFIIWMTLTGFCGLNISILLGQESQKESGEIQIAQDLPDSLEVSVPLVALKNVPFKLTITAFREDGTIAKKYNGLATLQNVYTKTDSGIQALTEGVPFTRGVATLNNVLIPEIGSHTIIVETASISSQKDLRVIPGFLSLLPPLFAIFLAFVARQVLISLFCGIWLGVIFLYDYNPILGFIRTLDTYIVNSLADPDHAAIIIFSLTLGGMVGVISKAGGTQGIVQKLSKFANHPRGGQLATWAMGLFIFFDDYANSLIVGNTMRPFTDKLRISREKLSYIVDSTAAPVASLAPISTWVGFQVGLIDQAFNSLNIPHDGYLIFLQSIPFSTYSILALVFVFVIAITLRDFGPMYAAEVRAANSGKVLRDGALPLTDSAALDMVADDKTPQRWYNALIPITTVILVTLVGLYINGRINLGEEAAVARLGQIFGAANSFNVLMWASFTGLLVAAIMVLLQKILNLGEIINATLSGYKSMLLAAMILILAWSIGAICNDLHTADYVIEFSRNLISPHLIPLITFVVAGFISFSTGTSWATMAILTPIVVPMAYKLPLAAGINSTLSHEILISTVGAVLSGSVLGDHCSPISDTTILSSMASAADHVDHVRTQLPYALIVGLVACLSGYLPNGWGIHTYFSLAGGVILIFLIIILLGKKITT